MAHNQSPYEENEWDFYIWNLTELYRAGLYPEVVPLWTIRRWSESVFMYNLESLTRYDFFLVLEAVCGVWIEMGV